MHGSGIAMKCLNSKQRRVRLKLRYHAERAPLPMRLAEPGPSRLGLFSLTVDLGWDDFGVRTWMSRSRNLLGRHGDASNGRALNGATLKIQAGETWRALLIARFW